ncbi:MAG: hypothetical protein ABEJ56_02160 [Candidatus Nanohaloarchaea archaeon]
MDAFHSRNSGQKSQNLTQNVDSLYLLSGSRMQELLDEVYSRYDSLIHESNQRQELSQLINLYKIVDRYDEGIVLDEEGNEVDLEELSELKQIVDRYLEGDLE